MPLLWLLTSRARVSTPRVGEFAPGLGFCWCRRSRSRHQALSLFHLFSVETFVSLHGLAKTLAVALRPSFLPFSREPSGLLLSLLIFFLSCWDDKRCSSDLSRKSAFLSRARAPSRTTPPKSKTWQFLWDSFNSPLQQQVGLPRANIACSTKTQALRGILAHGQMEFVTCLQEGVWETSQCFHGKRWLPGSV